MTTLNAPGSIPEDLADLLGSRGEPQCNPGWSGWDGEHFKFGYLGVYPYQNHRPVDERVVVILRPEHTTQKDG